MPRPPQAENLSNPLRTLRALCSEYGATAPLTQMELSRLTGIAPDYIRSLENARRQLSRAHAYKIQHSIGAVWNSKAKLWTVNGLPEEPFSYEWFKRYQTVWFEHPHQAEIEIHILCRRLIELMIQVERAEYQRLFSRIFHFLEELRQDLHLTGARRVFEKTEFEIDFMKDSKTGEITKLVRQFRKMDDEIVSNKEGSRFAEFLSFVFLTRPEHPRTPPKDWASSPPFTGSPWPAVAPDTDTPKKKKEKKSDA